MPGSSSSVQPSGTVSSGRGRACFELRCEEYEGLDNGPQKQNERGRYVANELRPSSLSAWVDGVVKSILSTRTSFAFYISACIRCCSGDRLSPTTALFPIPIPHDDVWLSRPSHFGKNRRERIALRRMVILVIGDLNFSYLSSPLSCLEGLRRQPSCVHIEVYKRLAAIIRAGGPSGLFSSLGCGRKSFQLDARLGELLVAVRSLGLEGHHQYSRPAQDVQVPVVNDKEELVPYRKLDPTRLKLTGTGEWDCRPYLSDLLYLPFVEPKINEYDIVPPSKVIPDFSSVSVDDAIGLCKVWDAKSLLKIFPWELGPMSMVGCTKVFNNYKSPTTDRQIGDRRAQNFKEGKIQGPSKHLPTGASLLQLAPLRFKEKLVGCVADRRDFYHQFWVTEERAMKNCIYPFLRAEQLQGTKAYDEMIEKFQKKRVQNRETFGDFLGGRPTPLLVNESSTVMACFSALFQGDHLGVEFATDSHSRLLQDHGLLRHESRLQSGSAISCDAVVSGLCIDDFFCISKEPLVQDDGAAARSVEAFRTAKGAYASEGLLGSDDKDVVGSDSFKVIGAEVISHPSAVKRGTVTVAAPFEKRLGLGFVSAIVASLPVTSDALHATLVGSWVSVLTFRRPAMSLINELFKIISPAELDTEAPRLRNLHRKAAEELQVLAALAPVLASNVAVPFLDEVFATDASLTHGGIAKAFVGEEIAKTFWRTADKKGANFPLLSKAAALLYTHDPEFEQHDFEEFGRSTNVGSDGDDITDVQRPLGLRFQFLELCGGAGKVTTRLSELGIVCGPIFDLSNSRQFDLADCRVVQWVIFMLEEDRLDSFLIAPPCTTFSPAAHPCKRSYKVPRGFNQQDPAVWIGNRLAFVGMAVACGIEVEKVWAWRNAAP